MVNESLTLVSWRSRPRSFVALMSLYESNYLRLGWLAGSLTTLSGRHRSSVRGDCDLLLSVTERTPYTTTLNMTYRFDASQFAEGASASSSGTTGPSAIASASPIEYPDLGVRIYHDAHLVEAQEWAAGSPKAPLHGVLQALRRHAERELDQRWARNMMLNKWLEYCLERGHRFSPATLVPAC